MITLKQKIILSMLNGVHSLMMAQPMSAFSLTTMIEVILMLKRIQDGVQEITDLSLQMTLHGKLALLLEI